MKHIGTFKENLQVAKDLYDDANTEISGKNWEEDESLWNDEQSETIKTEFDQNIDDIRNLPQNDIDVNPHNQFDQDVLKYKII